MTHPLVYTARCPDCLDTGIDVEALGEQPCYCAARKNVAGNTEPVDAVSPATYPAPATKKRRSGLLPSRRERTNR